MKTLSEEGDAFKAWWKSMEPSYGYNDVFESACDAWNAATLAERERCAKLCSDESTRYALWEVDRVARILQECADAIRNP